MATLLIASLIAALSSPGPAAPSLACSLLKASDVEAATGARPEEPVPGEQTIPGTARRTSTCTWLVRPDSAQIVVSAMPLPPGKNARDLAKSNAGMDALRAQHYQEETQDFGNSWCAVLTPPPSVKDGPTMSVCTAGPKGMIVSVAFMSPAKKLSIEKTKALLDKAAARLP